MTEKTANAQAEFIFPLDISGLSGRMLRLPAPSPRKRREILMIPGHHTSIERLSGLTEYINQFGVVTLPDMPGFGGMDSLYNIGEKATLDNLADYLASFIKVRYKNRRFTIMAISYGFAVVTRMLQKYPEIAKKVDLLVSWVGFVHKNDFKWKKSTIFWLRTGSWIFAHRLPAGFIQHVGLRGPIIRKTYHMVEDRHPKFKNTEDSTEKEKRIDFEIVLWQINDIRTYMACTNKMFSMNLCIEHIDLPVYHVAVENDHYFNNLVVEEHMRAIFKDFNLIKTKMPVHAPTVIATKEEVEAFVPPTLRQLLRKKVQ
jgi:pimeloyl-ACP methyl ester carboxylesterase